MRGWRELAPLVACVGLLASCTQTRNVYLTGRTSGATVQTQVITMSGQPSGEATLRLNGKTYTGRWVYMSGGGSVGLTTATAVSGAHTASSTGMALGLPSGGNGTMNLAASDGSTLRCIFQYSTWSRSGVGVCEGSDGEIYDIQIS